MTPEQDLLRTTANFIEAHPYLWKRGGGDQGAGCPSCVSIRMGAILGKSQSRYGQTFHNAAQHIVTTLQLPITHRGQCAYLDALYAWNDEGAKDVHEIIAGLDIAASTPFVFDPNVHMTDRV